MKHELVVCWFDIDTLKCVFRKKEVVVKPTQREVTFYENEDAGGGCYYNNKIKRTGVVTDYLVYDNEGNYMGEIDTYSKIKFVRENTYHMKVPTTNLTTKK